MKIKQKQGLYVLIILALALASPLLVARAQVNMIPPASSVTYRFPCPLNLCDPEATIRRVANVLFTASIPIVSIMILIGAFQIMTAGGKEENISKGKKTILYALIGFSVMFFAGAAGAIITSIFSP